MDAGFCGIVFEDGGDDLFGGVALQGRACCGAMLDADASEEEDQQVVDICEGADGGTDARGSAFLADGEDGGEPFGEVYRWLGEASEESARIDG